MLHVEVIYAKPDRQISRHLQAPSPISVQQAITLSGILPLCPEIDLSQHKVGIFSHIVPLSHLVCDGDRIEIYRPLPLDPKQARLLRVYGLNTLCTGQK